MNIESIELFQESTKYSYTTSEERKTAIIANINTLKKGVTKNQVID
jgi:hypothetical protein